MCRGEMRMERKTGVMLWGMLIARTREHIKGKRTSWVKMRDVIKISLLRNLSSSRVEGGWKRWRQREVFRRQFHKR